jgi:hypothetical protein
MRDVVNKIRLNNKLWFAVRGNKMVFGDSGDTSDCHYTISFGNRSGYFDLHLTNQKSNQHFSVFKISHQNIDEYLPKILDQIVKSVIELEPVDDKELKSPGVALYRFADIGDVLTEFSPLIKKDKLVIDKDSQDFKLIVDRLVAKSVPLELYPMQLDNLSTFTGLLRTGNKDELVGRNPLFGTQIFRLKKFDLDFNSVIEKLLGTETCNTILSKIGEGILTLKTG